MEIKEMEIIKEGSDPINTKYYGICINCLTQVSFYRYEAIFTSDEASGRRVYIDCPVCNYKIYVSI